MVKRFTFFLLVICFAFTCHAQVLSTYAADSVNGFRQINAVKSPYYVLDHLSAASTAAYSLRKLRSSYTGYAINVRRSSDNTATNIGFVGLNLDTATLLSFCAATYCFLTEWYDESGNGNNLVQSNASYQPVIVSAGVLQIQNGLPSGSFMGGFLTSSSITGAPSQFTGNIVGNMSSNASSFVRFMALLSAGDPNDYSTNTSVCLFVQNSSSVAVEAYRNDIPLSSQNITINQLFIASTVFGSTSNTTYINGSAGTSASFSATPLGSSLTLSLGASANGSEEILGYISEAIYFPSALSTTDRQTLEHNQEQFYSISGM